MFVLTIPMGKKVVFLIMEKVFDVMVLINILSYAKNILVMKNIF